MKNSEKVDYESQFLELQAAESHIQALLSNAIISSSEAAKQMKKIKDKKLKQKEEILKKVHITKDGTPRIVPEIPNTQGFYRSSLPDRTTITAKTREGLIDKLLAYYGIHVDTGTVEEVFVAADAARLSIKNYDIIETGTRHLQDFNRFFEKIRHTDITNWNHVNYNEYIKTQIQELGLIESAISKFQTITNIIFNYAFEKNLIASPWHKCIDWTSYYQYAVYAPKDSNNEIFTDDELKLIRDTIRERIDNPGKYAHYYHGFYACGYAILFTALVGTRIGEIPALLWTDVHWNENYIRIHRQQKRAHDGICAEVSYTKNEKRHPKNGRVFYLTPELKKLLLEIRDTQESLGIISDYIFCDRNGYPLQKKTIADALRRLCRDTLKLNVTKCHAFRKALNSSEEMQQLTSAQRGQLLGHSSRVNEMNYTIITDSNVLNAMKRVYADNSTDSGVHTTHLQRNIIPFKNKKPREPHIHKVL